MRDWQADPLDKLYGAAVAGDPYALLAIEMMPDRSDAPAPVTKGRKGKKGASPQGEIMRNMRWHEQVTALRHGLLGAARDVHKAARAVGASGTCYGEAEYLADLQRAGQYQGYARPARKQP